MFSAPLWVLQTQLKRHSQRCFPLQPLIRVASWTGLFKASEISPRRVMIPETGARMTVAAIAASTTRMVTTTKTTPIGPRLPISPTRPADIQSLPHPQTPLPNVFANSRATVQRLAQGPRPPTPLPMILRFPITTLRLKSFPLADLERPRWPRHLQMFRWFTTESPLSAATLRFLSAASTM